MDVAVSGALAPDGTLSRTAKSCGPGAATLALPAGFPSRTTGARKAASPGRARISRKAIARGKPGCLGCTCQNRVLSFATFAHGAAGAVGARLSLRPLLKRGTMNLQNSGENQAAGMRAYVSSSLRGATATTLLRLLHKLRRARSPPKLGERRRKQSTCPLAALWIASLRSQ
jgi:hypothetical protein